MEWNRERLRLLRCRMGWSHSDLARRLHCESELIMSWETGKSRPPRFQLEMLDLFEKQAEAHSDEMVSSTLADIVFDQDDTEQLDNNFIKNRFS